VTILGKHMTPKKLLQAALWAVVRCIALSALVSSRQMAQQLPTAESVAAKIKLSGVVRSAQGVPIPGATVDLVQTQTGQHLVTWTDESGKFELPGMPIGHYRYTVEQLGFDKYSTEADVSVDTKPIVLPLKISAVVAAAPVVAETTPAAPAEKAATETKTEKADAAKQGTAPGATQGDAPKTVDASKPDASKPDASKSGDASKPAAPQTAAGRGGQGGQGGQRGPRLGPDGKPLTPEQLAALRRSGAAGPGGRGGAGSFSRVNTTQTGPAEQLSADDQRGGGQDSGPLGDASSADAVVMTGGVARGTTSGADMNNFVMGVGMMGPGGGFGGDNGPGGPSGGNPFGNSADAGAGGMGGAPGFGGGPGGGGPGGGGGGRGGFGGGPGGGRGGPGRGGQQQGRGGRGGPQIGANGPQSAESLWGAQRLSRMQASRVRFSFTEGYTNSVFNARQYSLSGAAPPQIASYRNTAGLSLGGPFIIPKIYNGKEKTTFFMNYQFNRNRNPVNSYATVPTAAERGGDFSALSSTIYAPGILTGGSLASARTAFAGNVIPKAYLNSASVGLLQYIPLPNLPGTAQNFLLQTRTPSATDNLNVRIIHAINQKLNLSSVYNYSSSRSSGYNNYPDLTSHTDNLGQNAGLTLNQTWSKTFINSSQVTWNRSSVGTLNAYAYNNNIAGGLGITGISTDPINYGLPAISFTNFSGINDTIPVITHNQQWRTIDNVTWIHAKHNVRFGGELRKNQNNRLTSPQARGSFTFTGSLTSQLGPTGLPVSSTGVDFADFLLGYPYQTSERIASSATYLRYYGAIAYAQDDWRITPRFSVLYGIRYEFTPPWTELNGHMANIDINSTLTQAAVVTPGSVAPFSGSLPNSLVRPDYKQIAPRLGLAWRPSFLKKNSLTVRAGYSIFYNGSAYSQVSNALVNQPPWAQTQTRYTSDSALLTLLNGFPAQPVGSVQNTIAVDPDYRVGYAQIWNAGIEGQIVRNMVFNIAYTGTKGTRLDLLRSPNIYVGTGVDAARRIPTAAAFTYDQSDANSIYHALQVRITRRMSKGLMVNASYTLSKSIDDASSIGGGGQTVVQNDQNYAAERALSSFDVRHQLSFNYTYELPFGERKPFFSHGKIATVMGNWQFSGGTTLQTGTPYTVKLAGSASNNSGSGNNLSERPNVLGDPNLPASQRSPFAFFNTAVFAVPATGTFGDAGRNILTGPGSFSTNLSLMKGLRFGRDQQRRMDISARVNNLFNHPNFTGLNTSFPSQTFGRVAGTQSMRSMTLNLRFNF
jgi:trimeric autotransporter adhesin